jgi:hypothetical protein
MNDPTMITAIRARAEVKKSDELQGGIESVAYALEQGLISLPVTLKLPAPPVPDVLTFSGGEPALGIETTRAGWAALGPDTGEK